MKIRLPILLAMLAGPVLAARFAYVPNEKSATVSIIDTATDQPTANLPVGQRPRGAVTDGRLLYLTDAKEGSLLTLDPASGKVLRSTRLGASPEGLGLSADGKLLAAAVEDDNSVVLVETASGKELARIKVDGRNPEHAVFSSDGQLDLRKNAITICHRKNAISVWSTRRLPSGRTCPFMKTSPSPCASGSCPPPKSSAACARR